jgi:hypothetical protein
MSADLFIKRLKIFNLLIFDKKLISCILFFADKKFDFVGMRVFFLKFSLTFHRCLAGQCRTFSTNSKLGDKLKWLSDTQCAYNTSMSYGARNPTAVITPKFILVNDLEISHANSHIDIR